jgi:putative tricarboxylic transport membrane protein
MDLIANLSLRFWRGIHADQPDVRLIGCILGTLIGVLPGIGPVATIAMLLPATYALPPVSALIMLAGIYYGAQYGGSTTAILVNSAWRVVLGGDHHRRLPNGPKGPSWSGSGMLLVWAPSLPVRWAP